MVYIIFDSNKPSQFIFETVFQHILALRLNCNMIHIPPNTKFVDLGDFAIQYVEQDDIDILLQLFRIMKFHYKS